MSLNSILTAALSAIAPIEADTYEGKKPVYMTFNYTTLPANFGDDEPGFERALVQVHLFAPAGCDTLAKRSAIKKALSAAGLTWPGCTNASDKAGQHHIFECEAALPLGGVE